MIITLTIDPYVENEFIRLFEMMGFKKVDRHLSGGQMSAVTVTLTFDGDETKYHQEYYFFKGSNFYSLSYPNGFYTDNEEYFIEQSQKIKYQFVQIKRIGGKL